MQVFQVPLIQGSRIETQMIGAICFGAGDASVISSPPNFTLQRENVFWLIP